MSEKRFSVKLAAAGYYMVASMTVQFVNKALFTTLGFNFPLTVAFLQMGIICPVCYLVARPKVTYDLAHVMAPLALVNVFNVVCGLVSTGGLNVPMFIALRRFTLLCTIVLERFMYNRQHDRSTYGAVAIMILGAMVAAVTDLTFNVWGYTAVIGNNILTALYLIMVKNTPASADLSTTGLLFYNSALSLPLLGGALAFSGELSGVAAFPTLRDPRFQAVLAASALLGLTINHSTFVCTRVNEPLMTSVAGNLKNVLGTVVGALAFPDYHFDRLNVLGLVLSMVGAVWYALKSALEASRRREPLLPEKKPLIGRERPLHKLPSSGSSNAKLGSTTHSYPGSSESPTDAKPPAIVTSPSSETTPLLT